MVPGLMNWNLMGYSECGIGKHDEKKTMKLATYMNYEWLSNLVDEETKSLHCSPGRKSLVA
jgi:hypothetical protein